MNEEDARERAGVQGWVGCAALDSGSGRLTSCVTRRGTEEPGESSSDSCSVATQILKWLVVERRVPNV